MSQPKRVRARRPTEPARATVPDDLIGVPSGKVPVIPRPPRMPSDSASLPRAPLSLDFAELEELNRSFIDADSAATTERCPPEAQPLERPTVPASTSKTSGMRVRRR